MLVVMWLYNEICIYCKQYTHIVYYVQSEQRAYTVQKGCLKWKWLNWPIKKEHIHFFLGNEWSNLTVGEGRKHIFTHCKQSPNKKCSDHKCTNVEALWLEYKDMKQRTSSCCMRRNENKMLPWIFHGGTGVTIAYVSIFCDTLFNKSVWLETASLFLHFTWEKAEFDENHE